MMRAGYQSSCYFPSLPIVLFFFWNTCSLCYSLRMRSQVLCPYKLAFQVLFLEQVLEIAVTVLSYNWIWCLGTLCSKYAHWNYGSKISFVVLAARYFQRLSVEPWSTFTWPPQVMGLLPTKIDPLVLPCWFLRSSHRNCQL